MSSYDPCAGGAPYLAMSSDPAAVAAFCAARPGFTLEAPIAPMFDPLSLIVALAVCSAILFRQLFDPSAR